MICKGFALGFAYLVCTTPPAADTFCDNYKPVYWSRNDTRDTKAQTDKTNRKWKALCATGSRQ